MAGAFSVPNLDGLLCTSFLYFHDATRYFNQIEIAQSNKLLRCNLIASHLIILYIGILYKGYQEPHMYYFKILFIKAMMKVEYSPVYNPLQNCKNSFICSSP